MRLSLANADPFPRFDVAPTGVLFDCYFGLPGMSLNLAGRPALSTYDVWTDEVNLFTSLMPQMEVPISGLTPIGGMTGGAGIAAAFDGNPNKDSASSAYSSAVVSGFAFSNAIGFALPAAMPVTRILLTAPNDSPFMGDGSPAAFRILSSNTNSYATASRVTGGYCPPGLGLGTTEIELRLPNGKMPVYNWFDVYGNGINRAHCSQIKAYTTLPMSARGITADASGTPRNTGVLTVLGNSGPATFSPQALRYRGTILISETAGLMRSTVSYGLNRMMPIWNATDRQRITLTAGYDGDPISGHFRYSPAQGANGYYSFTPAMNNPNICLTFVDGMALNTPDLMYEQSLTEDDNTTPQSPVAYWNSVYVHDAAVPISATPFPFGHWGEQNFDTLGTVEGAVVTGKYTMPPCFGAVTAHAIEGCRGRVTGTFQEVNQRLTATFDC